MTTKNVFLSCLTVVLFGFAGRAQEINDSYYDQNLSIEERAEILVSQMTLDEKISQMTADAAAIPRLNIPDYHWWSEALHGVARNGKATIFPQAIGMGATFDPDLMYRVASAISTEARAKYDIAQKLGNHSKYAGLTFWSPTVNIFRDPRYGRGQECYGEDPLLMAKMGVAFVKGLQGDDPKHLKAAACAKHFALHSGPEHGKLRFNVEVSKQDLYETYFPAFEALVTEGKVEGVMTSYNMVFGKPACTSEFLIQETLRDKWHFDGYVTSDCGAIAGAAGKQGYAKTALEAAAMALKAGINLNCGGAYKQLKKAVEQGLVSEELINERLIQLYKTRFRLGMFDGDDNKTYKYSPEVIHCAEHIELAREAAQKSIVLLKNRNNVLPLSPEIKVPYVTGPWANSNDVLMGSYYGVSSGLVSIMEGVCDALSAGSSLNYRTGALPFHKNPNPANWAPNVAAESDAIICVVGTTRYMEGESVDAIASTWHGDKENLKLPENQIHYIQQLLAKKKKGSPFILVIASGGPVSLEGIEEHCDAILQIWYPGEQGGNAVADILFGKVSPSGHLPVTFPVNVNQLPPYDDYSMKGRTYKYMTASPLFPFGFGLSYSKTQFSDLSLADSKLKEGQDLQFTCSIKNVGTFDIEEVVQVYICPEDTSGGLPLKMLKTFQRVSLPHGTQQELTFRLPAKDLMVINERGEKVWKKGNYKLVVGNCSPGERGLELGAATPQEAIFQLK